MATGGLDVGSGLEENGGQGTNSLVQRNTPEAQRNDNALEDAQSGAFHGHGQESQSNITLFCYFWVLCL